ncbi:hypothetical protein AKO1_008521 [Acrasis kona]|uniref:Uncharacterized protein n=1 Tax=Acrasis kona TaxID=1008807 RepID=A0AAW2YMS8_9EUKA
MCEIIKHNRVWSIDNFLSRDECNQLIIQSKDIFKDAKLGATIEWTDTPLAEKIYDRLRNNYRGILLGDMSCLYQEKGRNVKLYGVDSKFKIQKFVKGQSKPKRSDASFSHKLITDNENFEVRSFVTITIFLNDLFAKGGEVNYYEFHDKPFSTVGPSAGRCLLHLHPQIYDHSAVFSEMDEKYVLTASVMYKCTHSNNASSDQSQSNTSSLQKIVGGSNIQTNSLFKKALVWSVIPTVTTVLSWFVAKKWFPNVKLFNK